MGTIELWECKECNGRTVGNYPCIANEPERVRCERKSHQKWEKITATIQEQLKPSEPRLEDLKIGDEIEVPCNAKSWITVPFITSLNGKVGVLLCEGDNVISFFDIWRLPLKNRIMVGQPVIVGSGTEGGRCRLFKNLDEDGKLEVASVGINARWNVWRLPTAHELKDIGHANGRDANGNPWLTEG